MTLLEALAQYAATQDRMHTAYLIRLLDAGKIDEVRKILAYLLEK